MSLSSQETSVAGGVTKDQKSNFGFKGWMLVLFGVILFFLGGGAVNDSMNIVVPSFATQYGFNPGVLSSLGTLGGIIGILGAIIMAWINNKIGPKKTIAINLILGAAAMFLWGNSDSLFKYALSLVLINTAMNGFLQIGLSCLAANWFPTKKGLAIGWMTVGANLSTALYIIIFSGIMSSYGLRGSFYFFGIIYCLMFFLTLLFVKNNPEDAGAYPDNDKTITKEQAEKLFKLGQAYSKTSPWTTKALLSNRTVWFVCIAFGIVIMMTFGMISQLVPAIMSYGYEQPYAIAMMTVAAIIGMVFSVLFGMLDSKIGTKKTSLVLYIWAVVAIAFMLIPGKWTIFPSVFFIGGFIGASNNLLPSIVITLFGRYDFDKAWAVIYPVLSFIRSLGFIATGTLAAVTGGFTVPYIVLLVCAVIGFFLVLSIDDRCIGRNFVSEEDLDI